MHAVSGSLQNSAQAAVTATDGTIYLAGYTSNPSTGFDMALWRFTPAGVLDTTFGGGLGYATHNNAAGGIGNDMGKSLALDASGNIYVTGNSDSVSSGANMALWRYTPEGSLDTTFGSDAGFVTYDIDAYDAGMAVTLDADGNVFVGEFAGNNGAKAVLWRFSPSSDGYGDAWPVTCCLPKDTSLRARSHYRLNMYFKTTIDEVLLYSFQYWRLQLEVNGLFGTVRRTKSTTQARLLVDNQVVITNKYGLDRALFDTNPTFDAFFIVYDRLPAYGSEAPLDVFLICLSAKFKSAATAGATKAHLKPMGRIFLSFDA